MAKPSNYLNSSFHKLLHLNNDESIEKFRGCSENEIMQIESLLPVPLKLPSAYKEFLMTAGHSMSGFRIHDHFFYKDVLYRLQNDAVNTIYFTKENIIEAGLSINTEDIFILDSYEEEGVYFIRLSEGDNPPVYSWMLYDRRIKKVSESYSDFLDKLINDYLIYLKSNSPTKK